MTGRTDEQDYHGFSSGTLKASYDGHQIAMENGLPYPPEITNRRCAVARQGRDLLLVDVASNPRSAMRLRRQSVAIVAWHLQ